MMYQVKVNDEFSFSIEPDGQNLRVNEVIAVVDEVVLDKNTKHLLYKNQSYTVEVVGLDIEEKAATIKVNGTIYTVGVKDQYDQLLQQMGLDNLTSNKILQVKAPMPGLVLNVLVAEGDEVKKGDSLLVLEAMKMENMIKSPTEGKIKQISVKQGDKVEKNEVLISFN